MILAAQCLSMMAAPALACSPIPLLDPLTWVIPTAAAAPRRGGGGARASGGGARAGGTAARSGGGMNRQAARSPGNVRASSNGSLNRSANVNRNTNVNRNVNVNNVNVNRGGYYGGGGCYGCGWDDDHFGAGLAVGAVTGAVVGAAVASNNNSTTVVVAPGSVVTALPSGCSAVSANGMTYQQCGSVWYQPQYVGTSVQYVVVSQP